MKVNYYAREQTEKLMDSNNRKIKGLFKQSFDIICRAQKQLCTQLLHSVKIITSLKPSTYSKQQTIIAEWVKIINNFLRSLGSQEYSCILPLLNFTVKKLLHLIKLNQVYEKNQQQTERTIKNKESEYYNSLIQTHSIFMDNTLIQAKSKNNIIIELGRNSILPQQTQCIGCCRTFVKNLVVENTNPAFPVSIDLSFKRAFSKNVIQRCVNTICNMGGGVILIGVKRIGGVSIIRGKKLLNQQAIYEKQKKIIAAIENIRPECKYVVQKILVHSNYKAMDPDQVALEYMRICFKILVFPVKKKMYSYINMKNKDSDIKNEIYIVDKEDSKIRKLDKSKIYIKIHQKFNNKGLNGVNSHQNIKCWRPYPFYSQLFYEQYNNGLMKPDSFCYESEDSDESEESIFDEEKSLTFDNWNQSLIIACSQNYDKHVEKLFNYMIQNKQKVHMERPYQDYFSKCVRSVWIFYHESNHQKIKDIFKSYIERSFTKPETMILMPVYTILEIQMSKFTPFVQQNLSCKFKQYFKQPEKFSKSCGKSYDSKYNEKKTYNIKFSNFKKSLFAYMFFEQLNFRPYFLSQQESGLKL